MLKIIALTYLFLLLALWVTILPRIKGVSLIGYYVVVAAVIVGVIGWIR